MKILFLYVWHLLSRLPWKRKVVITLEEITFGYKHFFCYSEFYARTPEMIASKLFLLALYRKSWVLQRIEVEKILPISQHYFLSTRLTHFRWIKITDTEIILTEKFQECIQKDIRSALCKKPRDQYFKWKYTFGDYFTIGDFPVVTAQAEELLFLKKRTKVSPLGKLAHS